MEDRNQNQFRAISAEGEDAEKLTAQSAHIDAHEVWQAAMQVIERYPQEPATTALQFADAAFQFKDFYMVLFWRAVARRIKELRGTAG